MTVSHARPVVAAPDLETAFAALRRRGMRISAPRRLVVEALFAAPGPVSAHELIGTADLEPASVYANLQALEEAGLVTHVHLAHGPGRYVLADRVERDYVECERCGAVQALRPSSLAGVRAAVREATGYLARFDHFPIVGLCPDCTAHPEEVRP